MLSPAFGLSTNECIKRSQPDFAGLGWSIANEPPPLERYVKQVVLFAYIILETPANIPL